jgi:perosamine synthetase
MRIPFGKPMIGEEERQAVAEVLEGNILVHGPRAEAFESEFAKFTGAPFAVSVSSCTAGMHLLYFCLGCGPGDEVIVPAQTHVATAHAVELTGAKPVFVDAETETGNIDIKMIEEAITPSTRAIAVVHYLGVPVDMVKIMEIAKKHDLFVLEDCALSPGACIDDIHTGLLGDAGVFSFYPVKHITSAEGGMIITRHEDLAAEAKLKKAFGVNRTHMERKIPGVYDTTALGFNYRMSELHAAIGFEQTKKLPQFLKARKENFTQLRNQLIEIKGLSVLDQPTGRFASSHYCLSLQLQDELAASREKIMQALTAKGIGSSIYYPQPVPRMTYYREKYDYDKSKYKVAAMLSDTSIALPVGPHLSKNDMDVIADELSIIIEGI